jgi:hypothetical protein
MNNLYSKDYQARPRKLSKKNVNSILINNTNFSCALDQELSLMLGMIFLFLIFLFYVWQEKMMKNTKI